MDPLGGYREIDLSIRLVTGGIFLGALGLVAVLERLQRSLRETEASRWWASNGRDVLNLFAFGILTYGLYLHGFIGPTLLLLSGAMVVLLTAAQSALGSGRGAVWASLGLTVAVGSPALLFPAKLAHLARLALEHLAP